MTIIAVDSNKSDLRKLKHAIKKAVSNCELCCFTNTQDALSYAENNRVDAAFLETNINNSDGLSFGKRLISLNCKTNIIFVTEHAYFAVDAFSVPASGYILKPITAEMIACEMAHLRWPVTI